MEVAEENTPFQVPKPASLIIHGLSPDYGQEACDLDTQHDLAASQSLGRSEQFLSVALVSDYKLTKEALFKALQDLTYRLKVKAFDTIESLISSSEERFDLILLIDHASGSSETMLLKNVTKAAEHFTAIPIIVLSDAVDYRQTSTMRAVFESGAQGLISMKSTSISLAVATLRLIEAGGTFAPADLLFPSEHDRAVTDPSQVRRPRFTTKQLSVLSHMAKGSANKTIAHELQMSESTVKIHVRNIMRKLGATNRTQAVYNAQRL